MIVRKQRDKLDQPGAAATNPLYERLKTVIRTRIGTGQYPVGATIPSTAELAGEFGVSVITVRRAVNDLIVEGRLRGRAGLGVFVNAATRVTRSLGSDLGISLADRMRMQGIEPGLLQLSLELVMPDEGLRDLLQLRRNTPVYRHEKLILADGIAVCVDTTHIPRALGDRLLKELPHEFLLPLLEKHDIGVGAIDYRVQARGALETEGAQLGVAAGSPLLSVHYVPCDAFGRPLFVGDTRSRPEWFAYEFHIQLQPRPEAG